MVAAWSLLEWTFVAAVGTLTLAAGLFALFLLLQTFRNTGFRRRSKRVR